MPILSHNPSGGEGQSRPTLEWLSKRLESLLVDFNSLSATLSGTRVHLTGAIPEDPKTEAKDEAASRPGAIDQVASQLNSLQYYHDLCQLEVQRIREAIGMKGQEKNDGGGPA